MRGDFYTWNTLDELQEILDIISVEDYDNKAKFIKENFNRFLGVCFS